MPRQGLGFLGARRARAILSNDHALERPMRLQSFITVAALLFAGLASAESADVNVISKVEVQDNGSAVVVSIRGTKPPNFTTFSMMDPPRFVIDFSESSFRGVPDDIPVNGGIITVIKNLSYGSDATSIARVMLAFGKEVDPPDVQTVGNTLQVKVAKPGGSGPAVVAEAPAAAPAPATPDAAAPALAVADADSKTKADADARAKADADAKARAEADAKTADEERKAQAKAEAEAKTKADAEAQAKADADAKQKGDADRARAKADEDERRAQADADAKAKARAEEQARADADAREREAAEKAERDRAAERERLAAAEKARSEERAIAPAAPAPAPEPAPAPTPVAQSSERLDVSTEPSQLREVGFRQLADVSRVFVRTNHPARYTISEASENVIRVELSNTRVKRRNDTRVMDTSFFPSAVAAVAPRREGSSYVLEIKLKQRVPYQQKVEGDMLAIDFERPAGLRGATPEAAPPAPKKAAEPELIDPAIEQPGAN
jgi:hypothetical protein